MRHERIKVLVEKQVVLFQCPGWSGNDQTIDVTLGSRCDRQCKGNQRRSGSVWSKRMINVLIVVLRAVVAVSNAVIAILELIREFVD